MTCPLVDDKDGFYKCVEDLAELGKPSKESFIGDFDWPILTDMRNDEDYKERIERAYAKVKNVKNSCKLGKAFILWSAPQKGTLPVLSY